MKLWIVKDKSDYIGVYYDRPIWQENKNGVIDWIGAFFGYLPSQSFPEVTFENSPQQVELKIV